METKALVEVVKGKPRVLLQTAEGTYIPIDAYMKYLKEKEKKQQKAVEEVKKIGKKEKIKAFLKKVVEKRKSQKENIRILKATIDAGKKALDTHVRGFSKSDNDATKFWDAVKLKMKTEDSNTRIFEFIRDWFYDVLSYPVSRGFATEYTDAPKDYIEDILVGIYKASQKKGSRFRVWSQEVEPPYSSRVRYEDIEKFKDMFPTLDIDEDLEEIREEGDEDYEIDDLPYKVEYFVSFPKK